jgi:hypothetical protein
MAFQRSSTVVLVPQVRFRIQTERSFGVWSFGSNHSPYQISLFIFKYSYTLTGRHAAKASGGGGGRECRMPMAVQCQCAAASSRVGQCRCSHSPLPASRPWDGRLVLSCLSALWVGTWEGGQGSPPSLLRHLPSRNRIASPVPYSHA